MNVQPPVEAIIQRIDASTAKLEKYQENKKKLSSFTAKLGDAYTVSLRLNVDLIQIVKRYNLFLDELEKLFAKIDNETLMTPEEIRVLKALTEQNIVKMTEEVSSNASTLDQLFKKFDLSDAPDTSSILKSLATIPAESEQTVKSFVLGGRRRSGKRKSCVKK